MGTLRVAQFIRYVIVLLIWNASRAEIPDRKPSKANSFGSTLYESYPQVTINKVSLTQKGYLQFLRYITEVPPLTDYTFCVWTRSKNLTYSHPLLSYSKEEKERFIRVWISQRGKSINLEILGHEVFQIPVGFQENHWYHICQSWDSKQGAWNFYLNGKLHNSGFVPKLQGITIPGNGDIVVGQEYTDFDKGLEDGIEGDVFGFNFILASAFPPVKLTHNFIETPLQVQRRNFNKPAPNSIYQTSYMNIYDVREKTAHLNDHRNENLHHLRRNAYFDQKNTEIASDQSELTEVPPVLSYFMVGANRAPKGILDFGQNRIRNVFYTLQSRPIVHVQSIDDFNADQDLTNLEYRPNTLIFSPYMNSVPINAAVRDANKRIHIGNSRILNDVAGSNYKPLGLILVELSFNCALGKGAPLSHKKVLISWTKSPVRVFGGAVMKQITPFCVRMQ